MPYEQTCSCGSGNGSYPVYDARGIYCGRACEECEERLRGKYREEIFENPNYEVEEPIEPEE